MPLPSPRRTIKTMNNAEVLLVLEHERRPILALAAGSIRRARTRYEAAGDAVTRQRLDALYDVLLEAVSASDLAGVHQYAENLAAQRYASGYDLSDVQTAINALEEAAWRRLCGRLQPDQLAVPLGVVGTVLGAAKDALAREYVALASQGHVVSLDMRALFAGDAA